MRINALVIGDEFSEKTHDSLECQACSVLFSKKFTVKVLSQDIINFVCSAGCVYPHFLFDHYIDIYKKLAEKLPGKKIVCGIRGYEKSLDMQKVCEYELSELQKGNSLPEKYPPGFYKFRKQSGAKVVPYLDVSAGIFFPPDMAWESLEDYPSVEEYLFYREDVVCIQLYDYYVNVDYLERSGSIGPMPF